MTTHHPVAGKLFVGVRVRRVRRDLGLTQVRMAAELGVSASYLNLIERNQRPVTAQFLLRLAKAYDVDIRALSGDADQHVVAELAEILADPLFSDVMLGPQELADVAAAGPGVSDALARLYRIHIENRRREEAARQAQPAGDRAEPPADDPVEVVRTYLQDQQNHFPAIEEAAEALAAEMAANGAELWPAAGQRLQERHGIRVRVVPVNVMPTSLRRFDRHKRQLFISEMLDSPGRTFAVAYQLALAELGQIIDRTVDASSITATATRRLLRINLANYAAAAVMMPYSRFLEAAKALAYDIQVLGARFGASFEQVCHRLTTLSRPSARGVPFFLVRVDSAGNISKRFSASSFPFSRFGGTCPLWIVHSTFKVPSRIFTQIVEMPDGGRYFTVARAVQRIVSSWARSEPELAIALGCDLKHAAQLVYSRGMNLDAPDATPIGINCRLCERPDCTQRAMPPLSRKLLIEEHARGIAPYRFE